MACVLVDRGYAHSIAGAWVRRGPHPDVHADGLSDGQARR